MNLSENNMYLNGNLIESEFEILKSEQNSSANDSGGDIMEKQDEVITNRIKEQNAAKIDQQKSCRDVFHAYLVENAEYDGDDEFPCIQTSKQLPNRIITFSEALKTKDYNQWVAFYEHDYQFVRVWNQPRRYLKILKRFRGVISPDFSIYRRMPICMQKWSVYQSRALGHWWSENGVEVIPNVRFAGYLSYNFCFKGIEKNSTVCIGSHGCLKRKDERVLFKEGLEEMIRQLQPRIIVVYGAAPDEIFDEYRIQGIEIIVFESECATSHKKEVR